MTKLNSNHKGMTLIELMIALTVFSLVVAGALSAIRSQSRGFTVGSDRMTLLQNLRFAANVLDKDLRVAGANMPDYQPYIVYAGADVVAFNGDWATNVANDPFAVYYDPDAPTGMVTAMKKNQKITLPNTAFAYPDTNFTGANGLNSSAETIIFFFTPDSSTTRTDDYALFRQVNNGNPELVARNLLQTQGLPFFQYLRLVTPVGAPRRIQQIPDANLPLSHSVPAHLAPSDTGAVAVIDSIRGIRVNFTATNGLTGPDEQKRAVSRVVQLPNAGLATKKTCGDEPLLGTGLNASAQTTGTGDRVVQLSWNPATDETTGEKDVVRYVIWRRVLGNNDWGDPFLSIPSGNQNYTFTDETVVVGTTYFYALAAQDCTPSLSSTATAGPVTP